MSGKPPKGQRGISSEDVARQLTRELHEAIKDGRELLRQMQAELHDLYEQEIHDAIQHDLTIAAEAISEGHGRIEQRISDLEKQAANDLVEVINATKQIWAGLREAEAKMIGYQSAEEAGRQIAQKMVEMAEGLAADERFAQVVAMEVITQLQEETGGRFAAAGSAHGQLMRAMKDSDSAITVTTSAIDGRPPGVYFDLRK